MTHINTMVMLENRTPNPVVTVNQSAEYFNKFCKTIVHRHIDQLQYQTSDKRKKSTPK